MTDTHHSSWPELEHTLAPEVSVRTSDIWGAVTCPECRLERPEDFTGRPEYRVPDHVKAVDASLAAQDRVRRLRDIEERIAFAAQGVADANVALVKALADRSDLLRPLSGTESAEKRLGVPVSTLTATEVAARLSMDERYWVRNGVTLTCSPVVMKQLRAAGLLHENTWELTNFGREVRNVLFEIS